jgi:rubrerythrin
MSIAMEQFGSRERRSEFRASDECPSRAFPYRLQCRACGFEPENAVTAPPRCPKCAGGSWERFALPGSLLMTAEQSASHLPAPYA